MKTCPSCGTANPADARFCAECATDLANVAVTPDGTATTNLGGSMTPPVSDSSSTISLGAQPGSPTPGMGATGPMSQPGYTPPPVYAGPPPNPYVGGTPQPGYPGSVMATPGQQMGTVQWLMFGGGVLLALLSLLFLPICFGPIGIGLGAGVYATGGPQGKRLGIGLMIGAGIAMVIGFILGAAAVMVNNS